jgi:hypothetical protein
MTTERATIIRQMFVLRPWPESSFLMQQHPETDRIIARKRGSQDCSRGIEAVEGVVGGEVRICHCTDEESRKAYH